MKRIQNYIQSELHGDLKRSYMEAFKDDNFKDLVNSIDAKEELLMKYTSQLEEVALERANCKKCKSLASCPNALKGHFYAAKKENNRIIFSYEMCKKQEEALELIAYQKNISYFQIPKEVAMASFKDLYKDSKARLPILKYFQNFITDYLDSKKVKGLYLSGSFGSGKTYLIAALFNELARKNIKSCMVYYPELLRTLKSSFNSDSYEEKFNMVRKAPLLLLDDIGAENMTVWARDEVLGPILQYRMDEGLPTFFTSNFTIEDLESLLCTASGSKEQVKARRIVERIRNLTIPMTLSSKNRRD